MTLRIIDCKATPNSIKVVYSDAVNVSSDDNSATKVGNYEIVENQSGVPSLVQLININPFRSGHVALTPSKSLTTGSSIVVTVKRVKNENLSDGLPMPPPSATVREPQDFIVAQVNGDDGDDKNLRGAARAVEDAVAYPVLTEEVGFAPSPLARPSGAPSGGGMASLGQTVTQAVSDVLGWKIKPDDAKGFVGALNASFTCSDVDGHTECTWTPRTYAVQTDLSGGITGAQASLYTRAQGALNQSLPLLDGLYPLDPEADAEDVAALKGIARSQLTELVNELGVAGGPRVARVNQYFQLLLLDGPPFPPTPVSSFVTDPDQIKGTLGSLRDELGLNFKTQDFVNTVQDEQDLSNFRILSDYVTSLAQSWINNLSFFGLGTTTPFFGTQLVLLSRQLSVVAESVDEVRFTLNSVFIGPAERQTLELQFAPGDQPLFAEDLFNWVQSFATEEGPRLIQDGGKFGVRFSFLPIVQQLQHLVASAQDPNPLNRGLPAGFHTFRVQRALKQLGDELDELENLASPIQHVIEAEPTKVDLNEMKTLLLSPRSTLIAFPPQLNFGHQTTGAESSPQSVTLFNAGNVSLTITRIIITGDSKDDFTINGAVTPQVLAPSQTLAVSVTFTPKQTSSGSGVRSASLSAFYNGAALSIPLSGTVLRAAASSASRK
jgi:hypothetical protein